MSGSSGSSGSIGFSTGAGSCESLVITTQLNSPKPAVVDKIGVGDELAVVTMQMGNTTTVVAMLDGELAGGIASPDLQRLRECLADGTHYVATVIGKSDGQVTVRVSVR
ncbi:hypothetical protein MX652_08580 [Thauera aromatica]|nr:hypothetical protein [Thauera aromatica]MCK2126743.1 hypothetical protein [Thauera aromatica]